MTAADTLTYFIYLHSHLQSQLLSVQQTIARTEEYAVPQDGIHVLYSLAGNMLAINVVCLYIVLIPISMRASDKKMNHFGTRFIHSIVFLKRLTGMYAFFAVYSNV